MAFSSPFMAKSPLHEIKGNTKLKDNVGKVEKGNLDPKEGEEFAQPDTVIDAYQGYRKRNVDTDEETTSVEEFNMNEDFLATDKFNKNKIIKQ